MSYTDLRDFAPEVTFHLYGSRLITISLEKLGGGTVGHRYAGTWRYVVTWGDRETLREQALETSLPITHLGAARLLANYLSSYGDPDSGYDGPNRPTGLALEMCQAEHHTFASFANEAEEDTERITADDMSDTRPQETLMADEIYISTPLGRHGFGRALARTAAELGLEVDYSHDRRWTRRSHRLRVTGPRTKAFCEAVVEVLAKKGEKQ